jgi:hypothetical protein
MSSVLGLVGLLLLAASAAVGIFLGWDKVPLSITACGFAIAGGLALVGCAIVEAARIRRDRE